MPNKLLRREPERGHQGKESSRAFRLRRCRTVEIGDDKTMRYKATVITAPEFELPDYSSIPVELKKGRGDRRACLRAGSTSFVSRMPTYAPVEDRPVAMGDYAVVTYQASFEGTPLGEVIPSAPHNCRAAAMAGCSMAEESLAPGFCQGHRRHERQRGADICSRISGGFSGSPTSLARRSTTPSPFTPSTRRPCPSSTTRWRKRSKPALRREQLRAKVRERIETVAAQQFENGKRQGAVNYLLSQVTCELPPTWSSARCPASCVRSFTRIRCAASATRRSGSIRTNSSAPRRTAPRSACARISLLLRIAEEEKLEVKEQDVAQRASRRWLPAMRFPSTSW